MIISTMAFIQNNESTEERDVEELTVKQVNISIVPTHIRSASALYHECCPPPL